MILYEPIQNNFKYLIQTRKTSRNSNSPFHVGPDKGLCIKYVGRGLEGFYGGLKIFRHVLMGHEIYFKDFDGPRNIFSCSILVILFFKFLS